GLVKRWIASLKTIGTSAATNSAWEAADESWVRPNAPAKEPPQSAGGSAAIDFYIRDGWKTAKVRPARVCDDATFLRRVYLDLAGRIPRTDQLNAFLKERSKSKRAAV